MLPSLPDAGSDPDIGFTADTLTGRSFDGTPVSVHPGAPTLVVVVAHWCAHCQREVPRLVEWNTDGDVPDGLTVIGVATAADRPTELPAVAVARRRTVSLAGHGGQLDS